MTLHKITLVLETDDSGWLERLQDDLVRLVCPFEGGEEHACPVPWMLIASTVPEEEEADYDDLLNR